MVATVTPSETVTYQNVGGNTHTFTSNGSFTFVYTDNAGNADSTIATVSNIDKTNPTATVSYDITTLTSSNVTATVTPSEQVTYQNVGGNKHVFTSNGNFTFIFTDMAGNQDSVIATVSNIDNSKPTASIAYSVTVPTNGNVTATATASEEVTYQNVGGNTHTFTVNGSFTFVFTDNAGNQDSVVATVSNIDKTNPTATVAYDITSPTNTDVVATVTPSEIVTYQSVGGNTHTFTANGSFTFVFTDAAGNQDSILSTVSNIDKILPVGSLVYSSTIPTNQDVVATLSASEEIVITNNGGSNEFKFIQNGSFVFEFTDAAGNANTATAEVSNIDKIAPVAQTISINNNEATTSTRFVQVAYSSSGADSVKFSGDVANAFAGKYISLDENPKAITLIAGKGQKTISVQFKDIAGNESSLIDDDIQLNGTTVLHNVADIVMDEDANKIFVGDLAYIFEEGNGNSLNYFINSSDGQKLITSVSNDSLYIKPSKNQNGEVSVYLSAQGPLNPAVFDTFKVTINPINDSPSAFDVASPSSKEKNNGIGVTFAWKKSIDADVATNSDVITYTLEVAEDSLFAAVKWTESTINLNMIPSRRLPNGIIYWRVKAADKAGVTVYASTKFRSLEVDTINPSIVAGILRSTDGVVNKDYLNIMFTVDEKHQSIPTVSGTIGSSSLTATTVLRDSSVSLYEAKFNGIAEGSFNYSISATDLVGNIGVFNKASQLNRISPDADGVLTTEDGKSVITFRKGSFNVEGFVLVDNLAVNSVSSKLNGTETEKVEHVEASGMKAMSRVMSSSADLKLNKRASITIDYREFLTEKMDERFVGIYRRNAAKNEWEYVGGEGNNGTVTTSLDELGEYAAFFNENHELLPTEFALGSNYPNPFNPTTTIPFDLPEASKVTIRIYNLLGQQIAVLVNGQEFKAGRQRMVWEGRSETGSQAASGIYFYRIEAGDFSAVKKMLMVK